MRSGEDLEHVAEDVLPQFEKFLESPEERRLRRLRGGVITASVGLGVSVVAFVLALDKSDFFVLMIPGFITFMIGLGILINGLLFTVMRKELPGNASDALAQRALDLAQSRLPYESSLAPALTNELGPGTNPQPVSVTEHTTHHLKTTK